MTPPAMHSQRLAEAKVKSEVPDASDAQATMEYWDEHRRKARLLLDTAGVRDRTDAAGNVSGEDIRKFVTIGEFPTAAAVLTKQIDEMLARVYREGGSPDYALITIEQARSYGLIGPLEYQWRRLRRSLSRGISKLRDSFGGASVRPERGTKPTA
jgi:hypothetical protein